MSISKETTIWCDGEDCFIWEQQSGTAAMVRKALRKQGWTRRDGKDLCPNCSCPKPQKQLTSKAG